MITFLDVHGAAWGHSRMEQALRNRAKWKA